MNEYDENYIETFFVIICYIDLCIFKVLFYFIIFFSILIKYHNNNN